MFGIDDVLSGIGKVVRSVLEGIAKIIKFFVDHPRIFAALVVALALSYGGWRLYSYTEGLKQDVKTLTETVNKQSNQIDTLKKDVSDCKSANDNNARVINSLTRDKKALNSIITNLNSKGKENEQELDQLRDKIRGMSEVDNGPVSNVLREAVKGIEENRAKREKQWSETK